MSYALIKKINEKYSDRILMVSPNCDIIMSKGCKLIQNDIYILSQIFEVTNFEKIYDDYYIMYTFLHENSIEVYDIYKYDSESSSFKFSHACRANNSSPKQNLGEMVNSDTLDNDLTIVIQAITLIQSDIQKYSCDAQNRKIECMELINHAKQRLLYEEGHKFMPSKFNTQNDNPNMQILHDNIYDVIYSIVTAVDGLSLGISSCDEIFKRINTKIERMERYFATS